MGNGLYGVEHSFFPSSADVIYSEMCNFMENVTGYPWVVEEVSAKEKIYYIDDSRNIGFSVYNSSNASSTGIFVVKNGQRSTLHSFISSRNANASYRCFLYFALSEDDNVIYISSYYGYSATQLSFGAIAAKDMNDNWAILYNSNKSQTYDTMLQCDSTKIDRSVRLGVCGSNIHGNPYNPDSYFSFAKCPNVFAGVEFKSLYLVLSSPATATMESNVGIGKVFATVDGKTLRLVPLYGGYVAFAFPVSE